MKKNWMQVVTLCLCGILLAVTFVQGKQLNEIQRQMESRMDNLRDHVEREIRNISNDIERELEEAGKVVAEYVLEPQGIDKETRSLQVTVSVTLKEWYEDTGIVLHAKVGGNELSLPMERDGNGSYVSWISLPLEGNSEVFLDALVTGGGLTKKETLGGWGDISMLLPLQNSGGGWGGPQYVGGIMSSQFHITLRMPNRISVPAPVRNPQFLTYRNGELVQTQSAVEDPYSAASDGRCYTVDTENNEWSVQCDIGDVVEVRFRCEDEYGLGYDFLFHTWIAEKETTGRVTHADAQDGILPLNLYWPE